MRGLFPHHQLQLFIFTTSRVQSQKRVLREKDASRFINEYTQSTYSHCFKKSNEWNNTKTVQHMFLKSDANVQTTGYRGNNRHAVLCVLAQSEVRRLIKTKSEIKSIRFEVNPVRYPCCGCGPQCEPHWATLSLSLAGFTLCESLASQVLRAFPPLP